MSMKTQPSTFQEKLKGACAKLGSAEKLYASLLRADIDISIPTIYSWLKGSRKPHPNNIKVVEPALDEILATKGK